MTTITPETLLNDGITPVHRGRAYCFEKGEAWFIHVGISWCLCSINCNIDNAYLPLLLGTCIKE